MQIFLALLVVLLTANACGSSGSVSWGAPVSVYKYFGSVQCTGGGTSLQALERQLSDGGIMVLSSACGYDGNIYPAVCGAGDGRIGIFEIPTDLAQAASTLGFAPLSNLPSATKIACQ